MNGCMEGRVWVCGDHIDTDMIIPSRFLVTSDEAELGKAAFADSDPGFAGKVEQGDILVAGRNFGCGSSREHAPLALRGAGICCILAVSFARTFYRNCINRGLYAVEIPDAASLFRQGDRVRVDIAAGVAVNTTTGATVPFAPYPPFLRDLCGSGGLLPYIESQLTLRTSRQSSPR